jgi:hypothetical protein
VYSLNSATTWVEILDAASPARSGTAAPVTPPA